MQTIEVKGLTFKHIYTFSHLVVYFYETRVIKATGLINQNSHWNSNCFQVKKIKLFTSCSR